MNYLKITITVYAIMLLVLNLKGQNTEEKITPFLKTGYGYFNDELMIDGNVLSGEIGIKLKNNYLFSLKMNFADAVNDKASLIDMPTNWDFNFIYSFKWVSLNMGYDFRTKNQHHSFIPMLGIYYANELTTYPDVNDRGGLELIKNNLEMVGIEISLQYLYNFNNGISLGLNASGCLAYQYGPLYFTAMPVVCFQLY